MVSPAHDPGATLVNVTADAADETLRNLICLNSGRFTTDAIFFAPVPVTVNDPDN